MIKIVQNLKWTHLSSASQLSLVLRSESDRPFSFKSVVSCEKRCDYLLWSLWVTETPSGTHLSFLSCLMSLTFLPMMIMGPPTSKLVYWASAFNIQALTHTCTIGPEPIPSGGTTQQSTDKEDIDNQETFCCNSWYCWTRFASFIFVVWYLYLFHSIIGDRIVNINGTHAVTKLEDLSIGMNDPNRTIGIVKGYDV